MTSILLLLVILKLLSPSQLTLASLVGPSVEHRCRRRGKAELLVGGCSGAMCDTIVSNLMAAIGLGFCKGIPGRRAGSSLFLLHRRVALSAGYGGSTARGIY
jgi:hypothetical protein